MRLTLFLAACTLAACSRSPAPEAAKAETPPPPPYISDLDVDEIMVHVMDPQARQFWAGWGEVYDSKGLHDVSAKTDDEWKKVEDGATGVVLATNSLMIPAYQRQPADQWIRFAREVADLAMQGRDAADKKDKAAMEDIGGRLDVACDECHKAFRKESAGPAKP